MTKYTPYIQALADKTEQFEAQVGELLEPWQRGLLFIALTLFLLFAVYSLTQTKAPTKTDPKKEKEIEEKLLRQMAFFKRLRE